MATVYPVVPGSPDYSTGSSSQYIPAIYSALVVKKFYPETVFSKISQTEYSGDIKGQGDSVYIRTRATIETFRYKKGMVLPIQTPSSPYVTLKIDQGEGFSIHLDKVDEFQSDLDLMNIWAEDAAKTQAQNIDRNLLISIAAAGAVAGGQLATTISGYNAAVGPTLDQFTVANGAIVNAASTARGTTISLGTSAAATTANTGDEITSLILKYGQYLDENNAPQDGRYVILPTWAGSVLKSMTNNSFGLAYATGQNSANMLSGNIPKIDRFDVMFSNNIPYSTESAANATSSVIFGCKYGTTFASQITESRIIDNPYAWGKLMQGLQVYGFNIIKPQLVGVDFIKNA